MNNQPTKNCQYRITHRKCFQIYLTFDNLHLSEKSRYSLNLYIYWSILFKSSFLTHANDSLWQKLFLSLVSILHDHIWERLDFSGVPFIEIKYISYLPLISTACKASYQKPMRYDCYTLGYNGEATSEPRPSGHSGWRLEEGFREEANISQLISKSQRTQWDKQQAGQYLSWTLAVKLALTGHSGILQTAGNMAQWLKSASLPSRSSSRLLQETQKVNAEGLITKWRPSLHSRHYKRHCTMLHPPNSSHWREKDI